MEKITGFVSSNSSIRGGLATGVTVNGVTCSISITPSIDVSDQLDVTASVQDAISITGVVGYPINVIVPEYPQYEGDYEVTPAKRDLVLETKEKLMVDDITVHPTPASEVSNVYGTTFTIG